MLLKVCSAKHHLPSLGIGIDLDVHPSLTTMGVELTWHMVTCASQEE